MIIRKVIVGFVIQQFDTETRKFTHQEFIANEDHNWETENGEPVDDEHIYGLGGVDEPELSLEMKQPSEIHRFSVGDSVVATPDQVDDTWHEFQGVVVDIRQSTPLFTVKDQDGDCFDCHPDQLKSPE